MRDRLLVAANAALASLAGNADTHFATVNEGAAPALVATLQHGAHLRLVSQEQLTEMAPNRAISLTTGQDNMLCLTLLLVQSVCMCKCMRSSFMH